jgi:Co/Zn/Cd efflux system component
MKVEVEENNQKYIHLEKSPNHKISKSQIFIVFIINSIVAFVACVVAYTTFIFPTK